MVVYAPHTQAEGCGCRAPAPRLDPPVHMHREERIAMTMDRGAAVQLETSQHIYTRDGDHLGKVKELRGRFFKGDAPMQPDYWLPIDAVAESSGDKVTLASEKHQLGDYKVKKPDDAPMAKDTGEPSRMGTHTETAVPAGLTGFSA